LSAAPTGWENNANGWAKEVFDVYTFDHATTSNPSITRGITGRVKWWTNVDRYRFEALSVSGQNLTDHDMRLINSGGVTVASVPFSNVSSTGYIFSDVALGPTGQFHLQVRWRYSSPFQWVEVMTFSVGDGGPNQVFEEEPPGEFTVSPSDLYFSGVGEDATVLLANPGGNGSWTVTNSAQWLLVSPSSGSGDEALLVSVDELAADQPARETSFTVSAGGETRIVSVSQAPWPVFHNGNDGYESKGPATKEEWDEFFAGFITYREAAFKKVAEDSSGLQQVGGMYLEEETGRVYSDRGQYVGDALQLVIPGSMATNWYLVDPTDGRVIAPLLGHAYGDLKGKPGPVFHAEAEKFFAENPTYAHKIQHPNGSSEALYSANHYNSSTAKTGYPIDPEINPTLSLPYFRSYAEVLAGGVQPINIGLISVSGDRFQEQLIRVNMMAGSTAQFEETQARGSSADFDDTAIVTSINQMGAMLQKQIEEERKQTAIVVGALDAIIAAQTSTLDARLQRLEKTEQAGEMVKALSDLGESIGGLADAVAGWADGDGDADLGGDWQASEGMDAGLVGASLGGVIQGHLETVFDAMEEKLGLSDWVGVFSATLDQTALPTIELAFWGSETAVFNFPFQEIWLPLLRWLITGFIVVKLVLYTFNKTVSILT
jgi:hypothetical protein